MKKQKRTFSASSIILCVLIEALIFIIILRAAFVAKEKKNTEKPEPTQSVVTYEIEASEPVVPTIPVLEKEQPEEPEPTETIEEDPPAPEVNSIYAGIEMSEEERNLMASVIYLEAGNQSARGQQAVAEVIFNRVINENFPDNVNDVLWQSGQFSVMPNLSASKAGQEQYDAIDAALYGQLILDPDVVFFSRGAENNRVWGWIGDHVFCREYIWK